MLFHFFSGFDSSFEFSLSVDDSENPEKFNLDSETGVLRNLELLNREEKDRYLHISS